MTPQVETFERDGLTVTLYLGDCLDVLPTISSDCAVVTDPPYGMDNDTDSERFSGGQTERGDGRAWPKIKGDDKPFDPSPFLDFEDVILWGANHYAQRLPVGTTLVWIKRSDDLFGSFLSDAEIGWQKGGHGVYCFRKQFPPPARMAENSGEVAHPNQKPVSLLDWCIRKRLKLAPGATVFDPYMGSGTCGVASIREGTHYIGVELEEMYYAIARRRILEALAQPALFQVA